MSAPGQRIDRYVIERQLGAGGFGAVYLARHSVLGTEVALKVLAAQHSTTPGMVERFLREAQLAAGIGSPHIVSVSDAGVSADGLPFLAMEVLEGEDLEERIRRTGALAIPEAIDLAIQILEGLGAAHAAGIVHRDMKPANVFLVRGPDGRPFVKLLDFGISKVVDPSKVSSLTKTGMMLGTPAYMAPEQLQDTRGVDHRADLYAAAAILFEMLSGRLPYAADSFGDLMERVQGRAPTRLDVHVPQAPPDLVAIVARGLAREPGERFASATEMARALREVRRSSFSSVPVTTASPRQLTPPLGAFDAPGMPATRGVPAASAGSSPPSYPSAPHGGHGTPPPLYASGPPPSGGPGTPPPSYPSGPPPSGGPGTPPPSYASGPAQYGGHGPPPSYASGPHGGLGTPPPSYGSGGPGGSVPSWGPTAAPAARRSTGLWIGVGALGLLLPIACVGGGFLAFGLSDDSAARADAARLARAGRRADASDAERADAERADAERTGTERTGAAASLEPRADDRDGRAPDRRADPRRRRRVRGAHRARGRLRSTLGSADQRALRAAPGPRAAPARRRTSRRARTAR